MEELGIGRPSTYASILQVLINRNYVEKDRGKHIPQERGRILTAFLNNFFGQYIEYDFTAVKSYSIYCPKKLFKNAVKILPLS